MGCFLDDEQNVLSNFCYDMGSMDCSAVTSGSAYAFMLEGFYTHRSI